MLQKNVEDTVDLDEELRQNCEELENKNSKHGRKNSFLRQNKVTNSVYNAFLFDL